MITRWRFNCYVGYTIDWQAGPTDNEGCLIKLQVMSGSISIGGDIDGVERCRDGLQFVNTGLRIEVT